MKQRRNHQDVFDHQAQAVCHNHLNGSAHCLECGGPCVIRDATQAALTCIVRGIIAMAEINHSPIPHYLTRILQEHGVNVEAMRVAAKEAAVLPRRA